MPRPSSGTSERRGRIVAAARRLMSDAEDLGFSMRTLAEQAGVSLATPYNLFGSKQAILLAVLDADLADYQAQLAALTVDGIDALFEANALMTTLLSRDPAFYRNVMQALLRDGPELQLMASGPRYQLWKRLLKQATDAGLLRADLDPDAFAIASSQLTLGTVTAWASGSLCLEEMDARIEYGLALTLLAIATEGGREPLIERLRRAEARLQQHWRGVLMRKLEQGELDDYDRALLADQLANLSAPSLEELPT